MRIAIVTLGIGLRYRQLTRRGLASKRYYGRKQRIPFILAREECLDPDRPPPWSKVKAVQRYLPNYDYIFLSDADVVFMNPAVDLREIITRDMGDADLMLTIDRFGLNFGNVFLRNTPFIFELMERMYQQTHLIYHRWWEQAAFIELYDSDPEIRRRTVAIKDQRIFNSYAPEVGDNAPAHCYHSGDLLVHFPGLRGNHLRNFMADYVALLKKREKASRLSKPTPPDREAAPAPAALPATPAP